MPPTPQGQHLPVPRPRAVPLRRTNLGGAAKVDARLVPPLVLFVEAVALPEGHLNLPSVFYLHLPFLLTEMERREEGPDGTF